MKIILLNDIPKVGRKYEVKEIASGYARNFLIPRGLAELATDKALAQIETMRHRVEEERKVQEDLLEKNIESLEGVTLVMKEKANDKGHLFAGVHKEEIVAELKKQDHIDMPADYIVLEHPIKELGEFDIEVKVQQKTARFKLRIEAV